MARSTHDVTTLILGAGAAGMMCAAHAGPGVLVIDHARAPGEKIRISGGGRCNFTNLHCAPENFLSQNPHFAKSALSRYTQWDFLDLVGRHKIAWHEKTLGQLFCDGSAKEIIAMLRAEMGAAELWLETSVDSVAHEGGVFTARLIRDGAPVTVRARNLVLATGGKSIPKMGATGLAYQLAAQFGHGLTETRPALVPLTFNDQIKARLAPLSGSSVDTRVTCNAGQFEEAMLFTHRGLSGPAILQISSYWREGDALSVCLRPDLDLAAHLRDRRAEAGGRAVSTILAELLPKKLAQYLVEELHLTGNMADLSDATLAELVTALTRWELRPTSSEGYRTAEVTLGGIDTRDISSKTMQSQRVAGLYMIGEAVDVTGWLGGYNFQWAWASGVAAGRAIMSARTTP